jgi:hypothetical protein
MSVETWGMIGAGIAALLAGLFLVRARGSRQLRVPAGFWCSGPSLKPARW